MMFDCDNTFSNICTQIVRWQHTSISTQVEILKVYNALRSFIMLVWVTIFLFYAKIPGGMRKMHLAILLIIRWHSWSFGDIVDQLVTIVIVWWHSSLFGDIVDRLVTFLIIWWHCWSFCDIVDHLVTFLIIWWYFWPFGDILNLLQTFAIMWWQS